MENVTISNDLISLNSLFWDNNSDETIILIGGSGDDKRKFVPLVNKLIELGVTKNILTFSFRGIEDRKYLPLKYQVEDLREVVEWLVNQGKTKLTLISASMGAYSASIVMTNPKYQKAITDSIFADPADYYINRSNLYEGSDWSDLPLKATGSSNLQNGIGNIKVHVINFLLRNFDKNGYAEISKRGLDNPDIYSRLSNDMVKSFYTNSPEGNRGQYIENDTIPHAFMRDGDIDKNVVNLANLLLQLLS